MLSYYKDGLNAQQIAEKMETTAASSAITHIRKKALSKLLHRDRIRLICIGKDAANTADNRSAAPRTMSLLLLVLRI